MFGRVSGEVFGSAAWFAGAPAAWSILFRVHRFADEGEMIDPEVRVQIRRYFYAEHWKVGTIAQALGVHPDTVKRAIEVELFHRAEQLRATLLDPYLPLAPDAGELPARARECLCVVPWFCTRPAVRQPEISGAGTPWQLDSFQSAPAGAGRSLSLRAASLSHSSIRSVQCRPQRHPPTTVLAGFHIPRSPESVPERVNSR